MIGYRADLHDCVWAAGPTEIIELKDAPEGAIIVDNNESHYGTGTLSVLTIEDRPTGNLLGKAQQRDRRDRNVAGDFVVTNKATGKKTLFKGVYIEKDWSDGKTHTWVFRYTCKVK